jgi:hypothetical protein
MLERSRARPTTRLHTLLLEPPSLSLFAAVRTVATVATVATVGDVPLARSLALPGPLSRSLALWLASVRVRVDSGAAAAPLSRSLSAALARSLALSRALGPPSLRGAADAPRSANWHTAASTRQYLYWCTSAFILLYSSKAGRRRSADAPRKANWCAVASTRGYWYFCTLVQQVNSSTRRTVASTRAAAERDRVFALATTFVL